MAALSFMPDEYVIAAQQLADYVLGLVLESPNAHHDPLERLGGIADDLDACMDALDESAGYDDLEEIRVDMERWTTDLQAIKSDMTRKVVDHFPTVLMRNMRRWR